MSFSKNILAVKSLIIVLLKGQQISFLYAYIFSPKSIMTKEYTYITPTHSFMAHSISYPILSLWSPGESFRLIKPLANVGSW